MNTRFIIQWKDISFELQQEIIEDVKAEELEKLKDEAREDEVTFKELMVEYYDIEDNEFFDINVSTFIEELALRRINIAFEKLSVFI